MSRALAYLVYLVLYMICYAVGSFFSKIAVIGIGFLTPGGATTEVALKVWLIIGVGSWIVSALVLSILFRLFPNKLIDTLGCVVMLILLVLPVFILLHFFFY